MATTNLGKVSVTPKGAWSSSNAYEKLDIVTNGGNGYIALKDVPSGTAITNTSYWLKIVAKGDKGDTGEINGASASISGGYGSPSVSVTEGGTSTDRSFAFAFSNLKGNGIESVALLSTSGEEKTYRMTFSDGTHFDYVVTDGEVTEESLAQTLEGYATIDGYFEDLTSGSTEEVISNVKITDQEPYTFRTSGGNAEIGSREEDTLVGVSVAFNQLLTNITSTFQEQNGVTVSSVNNYLTFSGTASATGYVEVSSQGWRFKIIENHIYFSVTPDFGNLSGFFQVPYGRLGQQRGTKIVKCTGSSSNAYFQVRVIEGENYDGVEGYVNLIDLTLAFGSDIADYLYTLEQAQAGEGVALAKKLGLNKYLGYNAGTLYSAQTDAHKMTGFNQWDEVWEVGTVTSPSVTNAICSKNFCPILPNMTYYATCGKTDGGSNNKYYLRVWIYDENKTYIKSGYYNNLTFTTPSNAAYFKIETNTSTVVYGNTYNHDICISIHWDNSRDTDYEPYVLHNYPIDPVVLRGILKKDADGNIYADGDTYEADGTVTRRYGIVDLGELNWSRIANSIIEGTYYFTPDVLPNGTIRQDGIMVGFTKATEPGTRNLTSDNTWANSASNVGKIYVRCDAYTDVASFKTAMSGVYFLYELAEPTTEQATPFTTPQIVDNWGTEEYPDYAVAQGDREYSVPMGHTTLYPISIRDKVEASADNPSNDGVYILQMSGGKATYIPLIIEDELPTAPTQDGSYVLKTVVSSGTATLSWVAE